METNKTAPASKPIAVDLDGTLVKTDTLVELWLRLVRCDPAAVIKSLWWWRAGRAELKRQLTERAGIKVETLPYNLEIVNFILAQRRAGRRVLLVTASDVRLARQVADHLQLFDEVMGSEKGVNLTGPRKAAALVERYGVRGFEYIGNSRADLAVWAKADVAHLVTSSQALVKQAAGIAQLGRVWTGEGSRVSLMWTALRPHQWVKNLLLLVPLLADHQLGVAALSRVGLALIAFCLVSSGVYIINDLLDLAADRRHPTKKNRPFAAGRLSLGHGLGMMVSLLGVGAGIVAQFGGRFIGLVMVYVLLNLVYSLGAKQIVLLDVIILAVLYGLRVLAGGAAVGVPVSAWLMALILFLAFSGALMKRYIELNRAGVLANGLLSGRGYEEADARLVGQLGVTSGLLSVLVLALYLNSVQVNRLYQRPEYWWIVALLLLYGVSRGWLYAYRGEVDDDPVIYLIRDPVYYWIIGLTVFLAILAI